MNKNIAFAGWKPDRKDENLSQETFGTWIRKVEMNKPVGDSDLKSVIDDCVKTWYIGHLSNAYGFKNVYSEKYEEAMKKYTVSVSEEDNKFIEEARTKLFGMEANQ